MVKGMDKKERAAFASHIHDEIAKLKAQLPGMEAGLKPVEPDVAIGRLSRLDTMLNQEVARAGVQQAKERIRKLEAALVRLENDPDFGLCADCGEPIAPARLMALPEAELCVDCAE